MQQKDIKLLWGRAGMKCSICKCQLSHDNKNTNEQFPIGEQAHIVGEKMKAPRGDSTMPLKERNQYHNLILLCPTHHTIIDKDEKSFTIEKLHQIKSHHELWIEERLSGDETKINVKELIYSNIIDTLATAFEFDNWTGWTSFVLSSDPSIKSEFKHVTFDIRQKIQKTLWPGIYPELEKSIETLTRVLHHLSWHFGDNQDIRPSDMTRLYSYRGYKQPFNMTPELQKLRLSEYNKWQEELDEIVFDATRAVNWFADVVRRDINPMFYALEGKFSLLYGPDENLVFNTSIPEFTEEEKKSMPAGYDEKWDERIKERFKPIEL